MFCVVGTHTHCVLLVQVQSAPDVEHPELKSHPRDTSEGDGITINSLPGDDGRGVANDRMREEGEDMDVDSPRGGVKMSFGVRGKSGGNGSKSGTPLGKRTAVEANVLGGEEEGELDAPKKKLASIQQIEKEQRDERKELDRELCRMALKYSGEDKKKIPPDERKKMIQTLVKGIPTTKEELFEYELKWDAIDQVIKVHIVYTPCEYIKFAMSMKCPFGHLQTLMEKRIGPWINKKIVEYIGEEEPTLTEFICNKVYTSHVHVGRILDFENSMSCILYRHLLQP